jgi:hypothetical protein
MELISLNQNTLGYGFYVNKVRDLRVDNRLNKLEITRTDGEKLISSSLDSKEIVIEGLILANSVVDLEGKQDELRKASNFTNGKIVVEYSGRYVTYNANFKNIVFSTDNQNYQHASFGITYEVSEPPFGVTSDSDGIVTQFEAETVESISSGYYTGTVSFDGSARPLPVIKITVVAEGDISSIDFINNGQQVILSPTLADGDVLLVDTDNKTVTQNGENIDFDGSLPEFNLDDNNYSLNIYSTSGTTLGENQSVFTSYRTIYGGRRVAQSFESADANIVPNIQLLLKKVGVVSGSITIRIETDSAGSPSGTAITGGTATLDASLVYNNASWANIAFTNPPAISATTLYWIVVSTTAGNESNRIEWAYNTNGGYEDGSAKLYTTSWSAITGDMTFKVYNLQADQVNLNETNESITETFTTDTYKDAGVTTANWNISTGQLEIAPTANTLDQSQTTQNDDGLGWGGSTTSDSHLIFQTFRPSENSTIQKVDLYLRRGSTATSGNVTVYIYNATEGTASNNSPTTLLATFTSIACSSLSTSYNWESFTGNADVVGGTRYAIVVSRSGNDNSEFNFVRWGIDNTNPYSNGRGGTNNNGGAWGTGSSYDTCFKTYKTTYASGIGQSNAYDNSSASIIQAVLTKNDTLPTTTTIDYTLSSNGSNFESITQGVEHSFSNIGSSLKFKAALTPTAYAGPSIQDLSIGYKLGAGIFATTTRVAQSFTAGQSGDLARVEINLRKVGSPGNLTVKIYSNSGGVPNTELATETISASNISTSLGWISVNYASKASTTASSVYWIVISAAGVSAGNGYYIRSRSDSSYAGGTLSYSTNSGTDYTDYTNEDILFKTFYSSGNAHNVKLDILYNKFWL